jgi:ATP-dependent DNA ligase
MTGNKSLLYLPFAERRSVLEETLLESQHVNLAKQLHVANASETHSTFLDAINNHYEGLIAKDPCSLYVPGSRDNDWIKLKEFTTLDLAVLGIYETAESIKAGKLFSAILCGSYNTDLNKFETVVKVKVGAVEDQEQIYSRIKDSLWEVNDSKLILFNPDMYKIQRKIPKKIVEYTRSNIAIVEIKTLDVTYSHNWHSCGLSYDTIHSHSLRLPTFVRLREDKTKRSDITTSQQMHNLYSQ